MYVNDYARQGVPTKQTVSCWGVGLVYMGFALSLPILMLGSTVAQGLGLYKGILSSLLAGLIMALISFFTGWIGAKTRLSTALINKITFGTKGSIIFNLFISGLMFAWFAISLGLFTLNLDLILPLGDYSERLWAVFGGFLMIVISAFGFKSLYKLNLVLVPIILSIMLWLCVDAFYVSGFSHIVGYKGTGDMSFWESVSIQIGVWMLALSLMPDLARYAKHPSDGSVAGFISFFIGLTILMILSMIPSLALGSASIFDFIILHTPRYVAIFFIILLFWSTNVFYMYSSGLSLTCVFPKMRKSSITWVLGIFAIFWGIFTNVIDYIPILLSLSSIVPVIGGAYVGDFLSRGKAYIFNAESRIKLRIQPILGFSAGLGMIICTVPKINGGLALFSFTNIPALDGFLAALVFTRIFNKMSKSKSY